jgi:hypothetical protein
VQEVFSATLADLLAILEQATSSGRGIHASGGALLALLQISCLLS